MKEECVLCRKGYLPPAVPTPVFEAMTIGEKSVKLCQFHDKYLHHWAQPEEKAEMLRIISDAVGEEIPGRSRKR